MIKKSNRLDDPFKYFKKNFIFKRVKKKDILIYSLKKNFLHFDNFSYQYISPNDVFIYYGSYISCFKRSDGKK